MRRYLIAGLISLPALLPGVVHSEPPALPADTSTAQAEQPPPKPKMVPMILIKKDKLSGTDPHLPDDVKRAYAGRIVTGSYKVCIGTSGVIDSVLPISGITGADEGIIKTLKEWRYKPQLIPICFVQFFEFHVAAGDSSLSDQMMAGKLLADAALALAGGEPQRALEVAQQVGLRGNAVADEAQRISGLAACLTKSAAEATASYRSIMNPAYRGMLVEVCRRSGLMMRGGSFSSQP